jgi:serine/threonine-protein phosphatase PGAM5
MRVPKERQDEVKSWFISPDWDIIKQREQYDNANKIGVRDIIMVRHGQYIQSDSKEGIVGNLTNLGKEQAITTGDRLKKVLSNRKVRIIYHSDMPRAEQTANEIAKNFPGVQVKKTSLLAEAIPIEPNPPSSNCPEYIPEEGQRLEKAFRTFFSRPSCLNDDNIECTNDSVDILVGHGNCFRFFVCRAMQLDPRCWLRMAIYNCGISWIELDKSGHVSIRGVGDIGHLDADKITYS